jgi:hypothetical protein
LTLYALEDGPLCVNELTEVLRERGLVNSERRGTAACYGLADKQLIQAVDLLRAILQSQMAADVRLAEALA